MKKYLLLAIGYAFCTLTIMASSPTLSQTVQTVEKIKKQYAPDKRQAIYEVDIKEIPSGFKLTGKISDKKTYKVLIDEFENQNIPYIDEIVVLPDTLWAQPHISVACIRTAPSHAAEMATQAIMGQPLRLLERDDDGWYRVQTPDGYIGWVTGSSITKKTDSQMDRWRNKERLIIVNPYQTKAWTNDTTTALREVVTDLVNGNIVEGKYEKDKERILITLPDGRTGWVNTTDVTPIETWAAQDFDPNVILDMAYSMEGTPYLWGGTSAKTLDCSGLAKVSYFANGIILMRDASQQALTGKRIEASDWKTCQPGDLLFFGNAKTGRVTHVAIYDHDGNYIHSSGRVKRNSVDPNSSTYLTTPFLHAVRIHGMEGSRGITFARNHPWYFSQNNK